MPRTSRVNWKEGADAVPRRMQVSQGSGVGELPEEPGEHQADVQFETMRAHGEVESGEVLDATEAAASPAWSR